MITPSAGVINAEGTRTKVVFWHSMEDNLGEAVNMLVDGFNQSQDVYEVEAQYQGDYDTSLNKFKTSMISGQGPDMIQVYEIGTRFMSDCGLIRPVQEFIDRDGVDVSVTEKNILNYYRFDGKLLSMPFNSSNPVLYYNADAFREVGLDPDSPPKNYDELNEYGLKLAGSGDSSDRVGMAFQAYGWYFEQSMVKLGLDMVDSGNGRAGVPTRAMFAENGGGEKIFAASKMLIDSGAAVNYGGENTNMFVTGKAAMVFSSTASLRGILGNVGDSFEVRTAFFPGVDPAVNNGVTLGGASLWMVETGNEETQNGVFELMKYLIEPQNQADWHMATGYYPINTLAYDLPIMTEHLTTLPQFQTAIDQLHTSPETALGAVFGVFTETRKIVETHWEMVLSGSETPEEAASAAEAETTKLLETYNKAN